MCEESGGEGSMAQQEQQAQPLSLSAHPPCSLTIQRGLPTKVRRLKPTVPLQAGRGSGGQAGKHSCVRGAGSWALAQT